MKVSGRNKKVALENRVEVFDTTLRDGTQSEHVSLSLQDKLDIARRLDELGVDFIEGGWPGSNPKDMDFFARAQKERWQHALVTAFGSTRHPKNVPEQDPNLKALVQSGAPALIIFGKTWDFHVTHALRVPLETNLDMIQSSLCFLKAKCKELLYDAEHFFDGWKANPEYAKRTLAAAVAGGAERLVLCDTNGGSLPEEITEITTAVQREFAGVRLGIHTHNDCGLAVANALAAVCAGCTHVQGTINGFGERCGNADLSVIIPNLMLKLKRDCLLGVAALRRMTETSRFVYDIANLPQRDNQPFVGRSAFAHKGGIHVSAVARAEATYEHVPPESVGNERRILVSELSGRSNLLATKGKKFGLEQRPEEMKKVLNRLMEMENQGYVFEAADAGFELLIRKTLGEYRSFFQLEGFHVLTEVNMAAGGGEKARPAAAHSAYLPATMATVKLSVDKTQRLTAAEGNGPVNALDRALREGLETFYPELRSVHLIDYKVRVVNPKAATAARVLVTIVSSDGENHWTTIGVHENIIAASWEALVDSVEYKLHHTRGVGGKKTGGATKPSKRES
jgi:2-isopropylmalate synthase